MKYLLIRKPVSVRTVQPPCGRTEELELPGGGQARVWGIAAERPGPDAAGEEGGQSRIVLGDPFQGYLDGAGYVDPDPLGCRAPRPITPAQPALPCAFPPKSFIFFLNPFYH